MADRRILLVTGSSRGIGRHLVEHYLAREFEVIGCSRSKLDQMSSPSYNHFVADITIEAEVVRLFAYIRARFGQLDVVLNNAGVNPALSLSLLTSHEAASQTMITNVLGTFVVSREAAKLMMLRNWGRIVNFSSMAVRHEVPGEAIYTASKAAVQALTRVMAKEFYRYGITCNAIAPSVVATDLMKSIPRKALEEVLARNAIPEIGKAEDISDAIDWLIRPESQTITGQVIFLGGA
jgi:3-oxoacyl-[acyl-carrier protein] reductase